MVTWSIGANQTISATGLDDTAPGVFGHVNKRFGTPDYAFVLMGLIATAITILAYVLDPNQTSVFWTLFALSSIVFLIPYLLMFPALLVLRHKYPDQPRPYVIPGGKAGAWIATILCEAGIVLTLFLFFYFPAEGVSKGTFWLDHRRWHDRLAPHRLVALLALQPQERRRGVRHRERRARIEGQRWQQPARRTARPSSSPSAATPSSSPARSAPSRSSSSTSTAPCAASPQLVEDGWRVVLTHGNGPQVGNLLIQNALAAKTVAPMPMDVCGAESQGQIGYMAAQTLANHLRKRKLDVPVVTIVTQVAVDPKDKAFADPSKPVGPFYSEAEARKMMLEEGLAMREDAGRGWRRVVPSPEPSEIVELEAVRDLLDGGALVVCSGGGGVPVVRSRGALSGIDAVIDKDLAAALLAQGARRRRAAHPHRRAPGLRRTTARPSRRRSARVTASQMRAYAAAGHFKAGSMGPKVEACLRFVDAGGESRHRQPHRGRPGDGRRGRDAHRAGRAGEGEAGAGHGEGRGQGGRGKAAGTKKAAARQGAGEEDAPRPARAAAPTSSTSHRAAARRRRVTAAPAARRPHEQAHRQHAPRRRLPHAGRVRAARADLDALAAAARQLAPRRQARAARLGRGGDGHLALRAGHRRRQPRPVRERRSTCCRPRVRVVEISSNDAWMRDCGPTFVVNDKGDVRLVDWDFNAWGGLYDGLYFPWDKDQLVPQKIAQLEGVDRYKAHARHGGRLVPRRRRGHRHHHRGVPAQPRPQPAT